MKANKFMLVALFAGALAMVSCEKTPQNPPVVDDGGNTEVVLEEAPALEAPGEGKVTIAVRAPKGTCNGLVAVGAATNEDGSDDWNPGAQTKKFTKVENTDTWYQITLPANPGMAVKVIAITEAGVADWGTQWGMNIEGEDPNVEILEGSTGALDNSEAYSVNLTPEITGITDGYIIRADDETVRQSVFTSTFNDYCGKDYKFVSGKEKKKLLKREDVKSMEKWPAKNCVAVIDDTVIIKLGTEGEN